jgi:hypothetical protein
VGDTVYASAFERYLNTDILSQGSAVDEYVYRLTTSENDETTLVDHQSITGYESLTSSEQTQWYVDNGYVNYEFSWRVFLCHDGAAGFETPTALSVDYLSIEDIFTGSVIDEDDNADFRALVNQGGNPLVTIVGEVEGNVLGNWSNGYSSFPAYAASVVQGNCAQGSTLEAFALTDSNGAMIPTKSFEIQDSLTFYIAQDRHSVSAVGATIGVTGVFSPYNAALFGLATIQAEATTSPNTGTNLAPYDGPSVKTVSEAQSGSTVFVTGEKLDSVTAVEVDGIRIPISNPTSTSFSFTLPVSVGPGVRDLDVISSFGMLTVQAALRVLGSTESVQSARGQWSKLQQAGTSVKLYAKEPMNVGKIQFFKDGKEIAWIRATDLSDPKLSFASGTPYLVRSVTLTPGKNRFEIKVDGVRVWRATYVPKS